MKTTQNERESAEYFAVLEQAGDFLQLGPTSMQKDDSLTERRLTWLWPRKFLGNSVRPLLSEDILERTNGL